MPSIPNFHVSFSRWIGLLFSRNKQFNGNDINNDNIVDQDNQISDPSECYACTDVGVPVFHSTSCDKAHRFKWEASAGSSLVPIQNQPNPTHLKPIIGWANEPISLTGPFGMVLDPRSKRVQMLNRMFLLARGMALAIDPLFFYTLSISQGGTPCLYMDGTLTAMVNVLRSCVDVVHIWHMWLQFRMAYVSRESLVVGCGKLVWDARAIASHYLRSDFWIDAFVILPIPQAVFWLILPKLMKGGQVKVIMTIILLTFLFQFLPKVYHCICLMRRMQEVTGYIFGTIWWGFGLNLIAYFIASHATGGFWYGLALQRAVSCLSQQCERQPVCNYSLSCSEQICYPFQLRTGTVAYPCGGNFMNSLCLDADGPFNYGIYQAALPAISSNSYAVRILYPIYWGLITLSSFGNVIAPTSQWLEVLFSICMVLSGLMLFTLLIGNIQVFLQTVMTKKRRMQLRCREMEWWMSRRQLPSHLRERVRHFERQSWSTTGGEDEMALIQHLPDGLRRDIRRHLCLDLIKKVPLFHNLDDLILDNICDRVKPLVFSEDEKIIREGDPVQRMVFVVHGRIKSSQTLSEGMVATSVLEPGRFFGDELLSWCLRRPFIDRLPASSATFICIEPTEAFGLDAKHLSYITDHFRYKFANGRLKRTARYYSSNWRTWAAVNIQLAWRHYKIRTREAGEGPTSLAMENGGVDRRLLRYAAMFMSISPHDHLE